MKFGIVLPIFLYNEKRVELARATFDSVQASIPPTESPLLFIAVRPGVVPSAEVFGQKWMSGFDVLVETVHPDSLVKGTEMSLAWGTQYVLDNFEDITHLIWLGDDALFKLDWLVQLEALVGRHPDAKAWSVYHSAHQAHHKDLVRVPWKELRGEFKNLDPLSTEQVAYDTGYDVLVRSICGHGMTFTREEWVAWGIDWRAGNQWSNAGGGDTLDLHHVYYRPGERWVTEKSYVQHTGVEGVHCTKSTPEFGLGF
jgi:hypothetical protein